MPDASLQTRLARLRYDSGVSQLDMALATGLSAATHQPASGKYQRRLNHDRQVQRWIQRLF